MKRPVDDKNMAPLQAEVCIRPQYGRDIWIVPRYTDKDRLEIAARDWDKVAMVLRAIPGSVIISSGKCKK